MAKRSKAALPGKRINAFSMQGSDLTIVGLDTEDGPEHPLWDERIELPLDEGLVRNIMVYGVLEWVLVRKNGPRVEVVDGRQRVRAAREATRRLVEEGKEPVLVPVKVRRDKDGASMGVMISANENRADDNPIVRAQKAQRMIDYGKTEEDVCIAFGISKQALRNLLATLDLSDKVQNMVARGKLAYSSAITLRDMTRDRQESAAEDLVKNNATVAEAKRQERIRRAQRNGKDVSDNDKPARGRAVKVKTLRKVAENEEFMESLEPQARDMLRWILGDEKAASRIKGLTALVREDG